MVEDPERPEEILAGLRCESIKGVCFFYDIAAEEWLGNLNRQGAFLSFL